MVRVGLAGNVVGVIEIPGFSGAVLTVASDVAFAADDFGHLVRYVPAVVVRPASVSDVSLAVRWAASRGLRVAARGMGHSVYGRSQVAGGVVVDLGDLSAVSVSGSRASVEAGASWRSVVAAALAEGLTPPVLTNFLDLSVGGTLSVGGVGGATHRYGFQTDTVLSLEVVTGSGEVVTCSPTVNPALFDAVRGGLGQFGIIVRAELALVPAPSCVRLYTLSYPSLAALAADQLRLLARGGLDHLQGSVLVGDTSRQYVLEVGVFDGEASLDAPAQVEEVPYSAYVHGFDRFTELLRSTGEWSLPHPWLLTFLPASTAVEVASSIASSLRPSDLGPHGRALFYPVPTAVLRTPLLRVPSEPVAFVFNLIRFGPENLVAQNERFSKQITEAGGVLYPASALPSTPTAWRAHFGPLWPGIEQDKESYDPAHLLTPGYELFPR